MFDVIVVGAGHAGCEAAAAASRIGANVCLVTNKFDNIGEMSCNPSIGGVGKGIIVREIDALDGLMAKAIDRAGIHFKMLNTSKGPAVWGPRAQADRKLYKAAMQELLTLNNIKICIGEVTDLIISENTILGVESTFGTLKGRSIVLTTGTFLGASIYIGDSKTSAGRWEEKSSLPLADSLLKGGLKVGKLKTGTPPRLDKNSIDWSILEPQPGDVPPVPFSYMSSVINIPQIDCYLTHTSELTHKIIKDNLGLRPGYAVEYCYVDPI